MVVQADLVDAEGITVADATAYSCKEVKASSRVRAAPMSETIVELFLIDEVVLEDRHLELERAIIVLVVDEEHTDEFLADINLGGIILLRPRYDADLGIAEYALRIRVELPNFLDVHGKSPIEI